MSPFSPRCHPQISPSSPKPTEIEGSSLGVCFLLRSLALTSMLKSLNHQTSTSPSLIDGETERPRPQGEVEVVFSSWQATASLNRDWTKTHEMREMDAPIVAVGDRNVIPHDGSQSYTTCGPGVAIALIWEPLFPHRGHFDLFELLQYPLRIKERTHMGPSGY